ncbi:conserved phage C-terminal domain-containing protein [Paenibacillus aquistagni]|uniref:Phage replication protein O n=1 Tax=Paenibacillus aquistagni TaxID=1852522 RepID=A0A1X7LYK6_9BACL|nr:conserved phage C-terminal domain-containing protein [Paenibacillus aquistagni]SMG58322.1 phage replication protein O [Paenibacillus aquistagni]
MKTGYVGIANKIWDEVIRRNFTKRQKDILLFLWRLSYGCQQDVAIVSKQKYFAICGVGEGHIGKELKILTECKVISRNGSEYRFNEDCHLWQVSPVRGWDEEIFKTILHDNIESSKRRKLTDSVSSANEETYQNGKYSKASNLPKQEVKQANKVTEMVSCQTGESEVETYQNSEISSEEKLPIREVVENTNLTDSVSSTSDDFEETYRKGKSKLTEKVSPTPKKASRGAASERSKYSIKDSKDKYIVEIVNHLNDKAGKNFSPKTKNTIKLISARLGEGRTLEDFKYVVDVKVAEWKGTDREKYLRPETLFTETHFEAYRNQPSPTSKVLTKGGGSRSQNNKARLQQRMGEIERESQTGDAFAFASINGLPDGRNN